MGELDHRPPLLKPARPPESMENPPRLASSNCSVGGCALCWNYNLRACTECVPVTDHIDRGCPCDEPPCKEWRVPRTGTAYRHDTLWMDVQPGKMELRAILAVLLNTRSRTGGPSVVDTCLWQSLSLTEGTRSISLRARRILPLGVRPAITIQA